MNSETNWDFKSMIYQYLRYEYALASTGRFEQRSATTQRELMRLTALLNAFAGGRYEVESAEGRVSIERAFNSGFGLGHEVCDKGKIMRLRALFPSQKIFFLKLRGKRPIVAQFYEPLFRAVRAGYKYRTLFEESYCVSEAFEAVRHFKSKAVDCVVAENDDILIDAMQIVLGERFTRIFNTRELISEYNYPEF